jgi:hypothetical protein
VRSRRARHSARASRAPGLRWILIVLLAIAATLATSTVQQTTLARYADIEACVTGCEAAAAGWPLPYLVDYPGLSPANEASLAGALMGVDRWRYEALAVDIALWALLFAIVVALWGRLRR